MNQKADRRQRYAQKLRDPRWQKKRLKILERDGWTCQECGDSETTLHVHHKRYGDGDPWQAPDSWLVTLCADCHGLETYHIPEALKSLCDAAREQFSAVDISYLAHLLKRFDASPEALIHFLKSPDLIQAAEEHRLERTRKNRENLYAQNGDSETERGDS